MDYMIRAIDKKKTFRLFMVKSTNAVEEARCRHNTTPTVSAALGRTLTAGLMMGYMMKNEKDKLTININGGGPIGTILAVVNNNGEIKGYVENSNVDLPLKPNGKLDVGGAVGINGKITVMMDIGLKEPYVGSTDIVTGEIGEDIAMYYWLSEQQNSAVALGVLVDRDYSIKSAGGFIVQTLPFVEDEDLEKLENVLNNLKSVSDYFDNDDDVEVIAKKLFVDFDIEIMEKIPVGFKCDCSEERMERGLISLGKKELKEIIEEDEQIETVCHFCNEKYLFNGDKLNNILKYIEQ
ncbi:Hsp33 family molecular chaperone HslO [Sedimentibacter hydroxybenzoicus DSM 7310]|uniref:33 kDa chaperonin n=1 Tax=Sedimentibacter hydroxybenzoicus DSM 7310 TaxID=1123245 RepID=A0A974BGL0_SEDHY|nr:Hsp33 family molecular chaperone HslO [Sedimentibacter hydroxybenzoicus]NYB72688.1 Hsp33 family molecular chaperone HslO [Sedimentibacter hydroxybenzoicus DSM 7310]